MPRITNCNPDLIAKTRRAGGLPLHVAAQANDCEALQELISQGVEVDAINATGHTALHLAVMTRYTTDDEAWGRKLQADFWQTLHILHGADASVQAVTEEDDTVLHLAARSGNNRHCVSWLLRQGALVNARNAQDNTPLHDAVRFAYDTQNIAYFGHQRLQARQMVYDLIDHGANVNALNGDGDTPLHLALCYHPSNEDYVDCLLSHGANATGCNKKGETPLFLAKRNEAIANDATWVVCDYIVSLLYEHGA